MVRLVNFDEPVQCCHSHLRRVPSYLTWPSFFLQAYRLELPEWHYTLPSVAMDDNENVRTVLVKDP